MANLLLDSDEWRFYGRRKGRKLNDARQKALDELYPKLAVEVKDDKIDLTDLFPFTPEKMVLEIGFGNGEHLAEMVRRDPDTAFIGAEPFLNGMSAFLFEDQMKEAKNVRVWSDDAIPLVDALPDYSIDTLYVLNPDPWHKTRHFKRRMINPHNLDRFSRILKPDGDLIFSTDVPDLAEWMITHGVNHNDFTWTAKSREDWLNPPKDWITTRYEVKGAKGAKVMHYFFMKRKK